MPNLRQGWFTIDFFSTLPIDHIVGAINDASADSSSAGDMAAQEQKVRTLKLLRVLRLARLLKLMRLFKLKRLFGSYAAKIYVPPVVADFFKNLVNLCFCAHLYCCLWCPSFPSLSLPPSRASRSRPRLTSSLPCFCCNASVVILLPSLPYLPPSARLSVCPLCSYHFI